MVFSKLEVLVELGDKPDEKLLSQTIGQLKAQDGVKEATVKDGAIIVETSLTSSQVVDMVAQASGKRAVLQGFGDPDTQSAAAMLSSHSCCGTAIGVIRFQQNKDKLILEGTIDGLTEGSHGLHVRETGDLSEGCKSIGGHFNPLGVSHGGQTDPPEKRHAGDLGNIVADENGRATFRIVDSVLKLGDIIGRSVAITEGEDDLGRGGHASSKIDGNSGETIACGIVARSAAILQNPKRICLCDGVPVWDERGRPLAGKGRRGDGDKKCCKV